MARPPIVREKELFHPRLKKKSPVRWIGWFRHYSQWEFLVDGYVILGEPYRED